MFITNEIKEKAQEALLAANGAEKVLFDDQMLLKLGSEEQQKASGERMPLGSFDSGDDKYILYNV
jgi:hypothetical protein